MVVENTPLMPLSNSWPLVEFLIAFLTPTRYVALTLMSHSQLPNRYGLDAFCTLVFRINQLPTHYSLDTWECVPISKTVQDQSKLDSIKYFGYACYPCLRPSNSTKLDSRSTHCLLIGYSLNHQGYRCLDPNGTKPIWSPKIDIKRPRVDQHTFSPVVYITTISLVLSLALNYGWTTLSLANDTSIKIQRSNRCNNITSQNLYVV